MTNPQLKIDPRRTAYRFYKDKSFALCGDVVLVPDPDNVEGVTRADLTPVAHWSDIEEADVPRLAVLVDSFGRFIDDGEDASVVVTDLDNTPSVQQIDGAPCVEAVELVFNAIKDHAPLVERTLQSPMMPELAALAEEFEKRHEQDNPERYGKPPAAANDNLPPMHPDPFNPDAADGLLGDISRWITATAIIPVPELSLASSIAFLAGVFGKVALTPTRAGVNVYITTLLGTAGGKGWPAKAIRTLSSQPCTAGAVTNGDPTSYAAMERILRKNSSTVVVFDEFGITLQDVNATHKNSVAAGIRKFLLAIYDQANSVFDGRIYASVETKKDESPIVGPALTVLGMTTVDTLYAGLSEASVSDGFLNRFLFITASPHQGEIAPPKLDHDASAPKELLEAIAKAKSAFPIDRSGEKKVVPMVGGNDGEAYRRWGQIFVWQQHAQSEVAARAAENTIRLATLRAISRNPGSPAVDLADVEWGWAITYSSINLIESGVKRHLSASPAEALRKAILAAVEDAPKGIPYSKLTTKKGVSKVQTRELYDALAWLILSDQIKDASGNKTPGAGSKFVLKKLE